MIIQGETFIESPRAIAIVISLFRDKTKSAEMII